MKSTTYRTGWSRSMQVLLCCVLCAGLLAGLLAPASVCAEGATSILTAVNAIAGSQFDNSQTPPQRY